MALPTIPTFAAGQPVLGSDLQALASALNFSMTAPIFEGISNAAQSIPHVTDTAVLLGTEIVDLYDGHSTSVNTSRYTFPIDALYLISGCITFVQNSTGARIGTWKLNGSTVTGSSTIPANTYTGTRVPMVTQLVQATAGQYVEMIAHQNSGAAINTEWSAGNGVTFCRMTVCLLRPL